MEDDIVDAIDPRSYIDVTLTAFGDSDNRAALAELVLAPITFLPVDSEWRGTERRWWMAM